MNFKHAARAVTAVAAAAGLAGMLGIFDSSARAASPGGGTLSPTSGPLTWNGFPGPGVSPEGETTCLEGLTCDTYNLTLAPGNYVGKRVRFKISWSVAANDYDVYVHLGNNAGPEVGRSGDGAPQVSEESTFDVNSVVVAGVNDQYTVHVVYWAVGPADPYRGEVSLEAIPQGPSRQATFVKGDKTGIKFSPNRPLYATGAGQDVEPSARVDYKGNAYAGGIRGLTGGNDIWRFDLNPSSPTYDPYLTAAAIQFDLEGQAQNPSYKGQPDAFHPDDESDLGGDGGGDLDIAVGFKPAEGGRARRGSRRSPSRASSRPTSRRSARRTAPTTTTATPPATPWSRSTTASGSSSSAATPSISATASSPASRRRRSTTSTGPTTGG